MLGRGLRSRRYQANPFVLRHQWSGELRSQHAVSRTRSREQDAKTSGMGDSLGRAVPELVEGDFLETERETGNLGFEHLSAIDFHHLILALHEAEASREWAP